MARIIAEGDAPLGVVAQPFAAMLARRAGHEPLSRILGQRAFHGLDFTLSPATLDPRPETEHLVDTVIAALAGHSAPRVVDLGTGSGAILVALAVRMPGLTGIGVDITPEAVETARGNAERNGVGERLTFQEGDLLAGVEGRFDAIVSNPPYIPSLELPTLMPEVRLHDPARALDGGADGLEFYRRIIADAPVHLASGGLLAFEIGQGQAKDVTALLGAGGFDPSPAIPDLAGIPRVLLARRA
jgi:release factor glutamine methyltransferase